ncbi:MAG: protein kinase [Cyanobacteria bacterium P01_D01_bin.156]
MSNSLPTTSRGQRALAAIIVTDAVGFSARMSVDEEKTLQLIEQDLQLMAEQCQALDGRVLKSTGDGLLLYFVSAVQAVSCAIAIQEAFTARSKDGKADHLIHRIGIHMGDVFFNNSDVMGNSVNIAARLQTQAKPGGICLSQLIYDLVKGRLSLDAEFAGPLQLKNIKEPIPAYHLNAGGIAPPNPAPAKSAAPPDVIKTPVLKEGTKVAGRYTIKRILGQGGFGYSYLVEDHQRFDELCVLKELRPVQKQSHFLQKAIELFKREAKTLHSINHPQIPKFMACFTQAKRLFIVQEYVDGVTYLKLLQHRKQQGKLFSESEVVVWLVHMLRVLDYLHRRNIMHRDISPENVMYSRDRNLPVLIDFGLVNDTMADALGESLTADEGLQKAHTAVGKFGYSPPEQMLGKCNRSSDLYALGVTALVLLTGKHPRHLMDAHTLAFDWQQHSRIDSRLGKILTKMTQQSPQDRFQSVKEVVTQLSPLLSKETRAKLSQVALQPLRSQAPIQQSLSKPDPSFISQCRDELLRCIGPIADMVIEETLEDYPSATPQELAEMLASQISDEDQATAFLSHICIPNEDLVNSETMPEMGEVIEPPQTLNPDFIKQCHQALAHCIGPIASMLIEETLVDYPNLGAAALVNQLAKEIPDGQKAQEFRQRLRGAVSAHSLER